MKEWLPDEVLYRKKSPYPKTHNPAFLDAVTEKLRDILADSSSPLTELADRSALEGLVSHSDRVQWYGQLMNLPQTIAFFVQLDYWLRKFNINLI